jgi:hypothetical protein
MHECKIDEIATAEIFASLAWVLLCVLSARLGGFLAFSLRIIVLSETNQELGEIGALLSYPHEGWRMEV